MIALLPHALSRTHRNDMLCLRAAYRRRWRTPYFLLWHLILVTTDERERVKALEREVQELRRANEILRTVSAFFAQAELDCRPW